MNQVSENRLDATQQADLSQADLSQAQTLHHTTALNTASMIHNMNTTGLSANTKNASTKNTSTSSRDAGTIDDKGTVPPPPSLLSPSFTPPRTPSLEDVVQDPTTTTTTTTTTTVHRPAQAPVSVPVDSSSPDGGCGTQQPALLPTLPVVQCSVRARIPTTRGVDMFLYLYTNSLDRKEHLAIVFGPHIRSRSLDAPRPGESEMDRMIRGAYTGRLYPGRQSSGLSTPTGAPHPPHTTKDSTSPNTNTNNSSTANNAATISTTSANSTHGQDEVTSDASNHMLPLVRIHSECYTGETAWSSRCDCGEQLNEAARLMSEFVGQDQHALDQTQDQTRDLDEDQTQGQTQDLDENLAQGHSLSPCGHRGGIIVYLRQEGRGIGLGEKLKAYNLQDLGNDTVEANLLLRHPADARTYGLATAILRDLGQHEIRLLTNNPDKIRAVEGPHREIIVRERVPMIPLAWRREATATAADGRVWSAEVEEYLKTKMEKMGHLLARP